MQPFSLCQEEVGGLLELPCEAEPLPADVRSRAARTAINLGDAYTRIPPPYSERGRPLDPAWGRNGANQRLT